MSLLENARPAFLTTRCFKRDSNSQRCFWRMEITVAASACKLGSFATSEFNIKTQRLRSTSMEMERWRRADRRVDAGGDLHSHGRSVYFDK